MASTLQEVLEKSAPGQIGPINTSCLSKVYDNGFYRYRSLIAPLIRLHCEACQGERTFERLGDANPDIKVAAINHLHLHYRCRDCQRFDKTYSLRLELLSIHGPLFGGKLGEWPVIGHDVPPRLLALLGADRELFVQGQRAEAHGLGLGALGYYRRAMEKQRNNLFEHVIRVAMKLGQPESAIEPYRAAEREPELESALQAAGAAAPEPLLITGRNPFALLGTALRRAEQVESDEDRLTLARDIRVVLTHLARKLGEELEEDEQLQDTLAHLSA